MNIKQRIFSRSARKQPPRNPRFPHMDRPLKVMLIYESDMLERNDAIKTIRQDLLRRQMDTTLWGYVKKKEISSLILPQSRILGQQDFTIWGTLRSDVVKDLQAEHYDLLLDLTTRPCLPLRYMALLTNADCKVGLNLGEGIHDMLLSLPDLLPEQGDQIQMEATWLYDQLIKYLTTIQSND